MANATANNPAANAAGRPTRRSIGVVDPHQLAARIAHQPVDYVPETEVPHSNIELQINARRTSIPGERDAADRRRSDHRDDYDRYTDQYNQCNDEVTRLCAVLAQQMRERKEASRGRKRSRDAHNLEAELMEDLEREEESCQQLAAIVRRKDVETAGRVYKDKAECASEHFLESGFEFVAVENGPYCNDTTAIMSAIAGLLMVHLYCKTFVQGAPLTQFKVEELRLSFDECKRNQEYSDEDAPIGAYDFPDQLCDVIDMLVDRHYLKVDHWSDRFEHRRYVLGSVFLGLMVAP